LALGADLLSVALLVAEYRWRHLFTWPPVSWLRRRGWANGFSRVMENVLGEFVQSD
jgi:hypothetical protein